MSKPVPQTPLGTHQQPHKLSEQVSHDPSLEKGSHLVDWQEGCPCPCWAGVECPSLPWGMLSPPLPHGATRETSIPLPTRCL